MPEISDEMRVVSSMKAKVETGWDNVAGVEPDADGDEDIIQYGEGLHSLRTVKSGSI